jgi:hypothetical protein
VYVPERVKKSTFVSIQTLGIICRNLQKVHNKFSHISSGSCWIVGLILLFGHQCDIPILLLSFTCRSLVQEVRAPGGRLGPVLGSRLGRELRSELGERLGSDPD